MTHEIQPSAVDLKEIEKHLPSPESQWKEAQYLTEMFDTTNRAGAGGTKAGLPGIRPKGDISAFHERYTSKGRVAPKKDEPLRFNTPTHRNEFATKHQIELPRTFCVDCGADCGTPACVDVVWFDDQAIAEALGIKRRETIIGFIGKPCFDKFKNKKTEKELHLVVNGQQTTTKQIELERRRTRIMDNYIGFIKARRTAGDFSIYTDARTA